MSSICLLGAGVAQFYPHLAPSAAEKAGDSCARQGGNECTQQAGLCYLLGMSLLDSAVMLMRVQEQGRKVRGPLKALEGESSGGLLQEALEGSEWTFHSRE